MPWELCSEPTELIHLTSPCYNQTNEWIYNMKNRNLILYKAGGRRVSIIADPSEQINSQ